MTPAGTWIVNAAGERVMQNHPYTHLLLHILSGLFGVTLVSVPLIQALIRCEGVARKHLRPSSHPHFAVIECVRRNKAACSLRLNLLV